MTLVWKSGLNLQSPTANDPLLDLNTQPSLDLQFATSKTLDDRVSGNNLITFSRADATTCATYVDSNGVIQTAAANVPRFDHDPATGESLGLLIEESRTNLLNWSDYSQVLAATTTATLEGLAIAPDGTNTARRYSSSSGEKTINKIIFDGNAGSDYTFSVYVRSMGAASQVRLQVGDGPYTDTFDISTEWQRLDITKVNNASAICRAYVRILNTGDEVAVWGAQLEVCTFPTSYIPTTDSTVTRSPDIATIEGTNFSSWYSQSEGTVFTDRTFTINNGHTYYFTDSTLIANRLRLQAVTHSGNNSSDGSFFQAAVAGNKTAIGLQTDNVSLNGGTPDTSFTLPSSLDRLFIGRHPTVSSYLNGHISRLTYYPYRLADATLQEITS